MAQDSEMQQWMEGFREAYAGLSPRVYADDDPLIRQVVTTAKPFGCVTSRF